MKQLIILILLILPLNARAEDLPAEAAATAQTGDQATEDSDRQAGYFDENVTQDGFFTDDQAGIPVKNAAGNTTTRREDSFNLSGRNRRGSISTGPTGLPAGFKLRGRGGLRSMGISTNSPYSRGAPVPPPAPPPPAGGAGRLGDSFDIRGPQN